MLQYQGLYAEKWKEVQINSGTASRSKAVRCNLVLGELSRNCQGKGICKVLPLHRTTSCCPIVEATISFHDSGFLWLFLQSKQQRAIAPDHQTSFVMNEDFALPNWLCERLPLPASGAVIRAGRYPRLELLDCVLIQCPLDLSDPGSERNR